MLSVASGKGNAQSGWKGGEGGLESLERQFGGKGTWRRWCRPARSRRRTETMENCPSLKCFYAILGVTKESSPTEIRTAYRQLAKRWHPDKCSNAKDDAKEEAKLIFQRIQHAYAVLSDEKKRVLYDAGLHEVVERDPSLQDLMGELANLMAGIPSTAPPRAKASKCAQSKETDDYEELQKLFMNMVDASNDHVQDGRDFDKAFPVAENSTSATAPLRGATSWSPPGKTSYTDKQTFPVSDSANIGRKFPSEEGREQCQSPKPHANLFKGMDYDCYYGTNYDLSYDSLDDMCTTSPHEYDGLSPSSPKPHASLYTGDHYHEFASSAPAGCTFGINQPANPRFAQSNFASIPLSGCSTAMRDDHERPPAQLSCEGFCMGASDDTPDKAHHPRIMGRHSKGWRRRCKDKKVGGFSPPPKCNICGRGNLSGSTACSCAVGNGSHQ